MSARAVTAAQLRAYVAKAREAGSKVVGFHAAPLWSDTATLGEDVVVAACPSTLAVRAAVWDHLAVDDGRLLVVLTQREDVGVEVLARFYRGALLHPESFEILKDLFRVTEVALPLRDHQWLADLLVDVAPVGRTFAPPPGGVLDLDAAWRAMLVHGLGLATDQPTLRDLLGWSAGTEAAAALARFAQADVDKIAAGLSTRVGPTAGCLVTLVRKGRAADTIPSGLVAAVLWGAGTTDAQTIAARTRFEVALGDPSLGTVAAKAWGAAAEALVRQSAAAVDQTAFTSWTARADAILTEVRAPTLVVRSPVLPRAFDARLDAVGQAVLAAVENPTDALMAVVSSAAGAVRDHVDAERLSHRVRTVDMAQRLVRRLVNGRPPTDPPADLAQAAAQYVSEGAWLDDARQALTDGDPVTSLGAAAHALVRAVTQERTEEDTRFATRLAQWSTVAPTGNDGVLPIEQVLDRAAVPAVRAGVPVLLLLLDGLSWAQAHRMFDDIARRRFRRVAPEGRWEAVVSALPSVTQVSRSSLFAGYPVAGGQDVEREQFAHHPGLLDATKGCAPVLFHKAALYAVDGQPAPDVRTAVTNPQQQVVGVVVNGADDHLDKGAQLELAAGLRALKPLDQLLAWAVEADRAVVVVADHGHVREAGSTVRPAPGGGERWRPAEGSPAADEVVVAGPRVLKGNGRIILPATEGVRYHPTKKLGYHGGATPQEVLCPLAVFVPGLVEIPGWLAELPAQPPWWDDQALVEPDPPAHVPAVAPPTDAKGVPTLFDDEARPAQPAVVAGDGVDWVVALMASPVFAQQERAAGRQTLDRATVAHLLTQLHRAGGTLTRDAFARAAGSNPSRARGKATALAALLNVDGYAAINVDGSGEVRLARSVLFAQFDLASDSD